MTAQLPLGDRGADLSDDGRYRYRLWRSWGPGLRMTFIMLNPSTADADQDDLTVRRCCSFARREGCDGIVIINLYAYRATDPRELQRAYLLDEDVAGPENLAWLNRALDEADGPVVLAWGDSLPRGSRAPLNVACALQAYGIVPYCLGQTKSGSPRHPSRLAGDTPLVPAR